MVAAAAVQEQQQPAGEERKVTLRKPVGVVFAQNKGGPVFVEELTAGGNADKSGMVQVGGWWQVDLRLGAADSVQTSQAVAAGVSLLSCRLGTC